MLKRELGFRNIPHPILLLLTILVLVGSIGSANASVQNTYYPSNYNILNGTYLSGGFPSSIQTVDSDYFMVRSSPSATSASIYNPSAYNLLGSTAYVSGTTGDLTSDNGVYIVYRSYPSASSAQTLYAHQETTTIGGNLYYLQKPESADSPGTSLSASMATIGRQLLGKFVYPLTGISSVPASTWTIFYRTWRDSDPGIAFDAVGSGNNGDGATSVSWTHVVGSGTNRLMMIGISIKDVTVSVLNVIVGVQSASFLRSDVRGTEIKGEIWYLINPDSGSKTVTVTLSGTSRASGGSVSYTGVAQTSPIDAQGGVPYGGETPSVSLTTTVDNDWIFSNLAISGTATATAHTSGQVHRYYQVGTGAGPQLAGDDGDDKPTTIAGSYTMSWNMSWWAAVVAQAVAFKPAPPPVGHVDVDILIRQSDGTIRTTIATNVANSGDLTSIPATLSGTYSWAAYSVVDQTDYLEIDYYVEVTAALSTTAAYFRIDDSALLTPDQTRGTNIMLPSEYTVEVELTGASNTYNWTQLTWTINSAWTTDAVTVTLQLYNYTLGAYPTSGNGFISYTSSATANTDETKTQTITTNPQHFRDASGNWKIKVKGVKTTTNQFDFKADWVKFELTYWSEYTISTEFLFSSMTMKTPTELNFTVVSQYNLIGVDVTIQIWDYSVSTYAKSGAAYLKYTSSGTNETKLLSINTNPQFYTSNGNAKIKITGVLSTTTPYQQETNQVKLLYSYSGVNSTPVLDPIGNKTVDELTLLTFTATASDADFDPLTFSLGAGAPSGTLINATTGVFTWTPTEAQGPGLYTIRIIVSDGSLTDFEDINVTVNEVNSAPVLDSIGPKSVNILGQLTFTATASDPDIPAQTLTFSFGAGAPSGAFINSTTGEFTWTPAVDQGSDNYTIRVVVSDGFLTDYEDISVTVYEVHIHDVAVISVTASPTNVVSGQVVSVTVTVKNNGTATETFNVTVFYNETMIETKTVNGLAPGDQRTLEFTWNTTGLTEASYRMQAVADSVSGETDTNNNTYTGAIVTVSTPASMPPFDWVTALLYMLPVLFGFLFLLGFGYKRKKKTKPHIEKKTDAFSQQFGITHQQMIGKKMLLEIDPTSDYLKALSSFVSEAKNNNELLFVLTNQNSTLHSAISGAENAFFLLLTPKTFTPQQINEKETLLPASDLSVILDACAKIQKVEAEKNIYLLFDNLSDVALRCGFEKTYKFVRLLLQAISPPKITALFVFIPTAHDQTITSSIRGLFHNQLAYTKSGSKVGTL